MGSGPTKILKGALWIEAVILLVLTSLLADADAWIGAIVTGVGLLLVVIGVVAAHKQRIGYLYCYATLVGLWEILALTHVLIICGLITLPPSLVKAAYVVGQKALGNPSDSMKIAIPMLYGFQWGTWCITLVCLSSLRTAPRDPVVALEIQEPKRPHSIEASRSHTSLSNNPRMSQHLFNFRQSVISPQARTTRAGSILHGTGSGSGCGSIPRSGNGVEGYSTSKLNRGKETFALQHSFDNCIPQAPERAWVGTERRSSSDSNAIYFPNDSRISQVVVTFRNEVKSNYDQQSQQRSSHAPHPLKTTEVGLRKLPMAEDTTVYINDHNHNAYIEEGPSASDVLKGDKDMYKIKFFPSGESLSDMIFKSSKQSIVAEGLSSQYRPKIDIPNPARIRATATKASLTLSSDSSSSELSAVSNTSGSESGDQEQDIEETPAANNVSNMSSDEPVSQETVIADLGMVSMRSLDVIPKDQSQLRSDTMEILSSDEESVNAPRQDTDSSEMIKSTSVRRILHDYEDPSSHDWADEPSGLPPQMQPNSSDSSSSLSSSSLSSISSSSSTPRREDPHENIFRRQSHSRNKIVLTNGFGDMTPPEVLAKTLSESSSIPQSMTSNSFSQPTPISVLPSPPSPPSPPFPASSTYPTSIHPLSSTVMPPIENITNTSFIPVSRSKPRIVSSPLQYWRSRTSNGIESPVSTMPSFPQSYIASPFSKKKKFSVPTIVLHPDEEDGESPRVLSQKDIDYLTTMPPAPLRLLVQPWDEGAEDDEYEDRVINEGYDYDEYHRHHHEAFEHGIESEDFGEVEMDGYNDCELRDSEEFDPYALDVPIDLDVDLQELGRNTFKSGYGYI